MKISQYQCLSDIGIFIAFLDFLLSCVTRTTASDYYVRTKYTAKDVLFHGNVFKAPCLKFELFKTLFRNEKRKMH